MSRREDGLRPSQVARAKRVARVIGTHVQPKLPRAVRNVIVRLKEQHLRLRDLDTPNGYEAIAAIISTMTSKDMFEATPALGKVWELVASRALQYMGDERMRMPAAPLNTYVRSR